MSVPMTLLTVGASLGVGAVSAPFIAGALSQPITGAVVPTRITDLAGYLTASGAAPAKGSKGLGQEDFGSQTSFGDPATSPTGIEDADLGQSIDTTPTSNGSSPTSGTNATVNFGKTGTSGKAPAGPATADQKRILAVASFGAALALATATFFLIRRVTQ